MSGKSCHRYMLRCRDSVCCICFSVREADWLMERNGGMDYGTTTEIGRAESVNRIKAGEVKPMRKRELSAKDKEKLEAYQESMEIANENGMTAVQEDELPF